MPTRNQVRKATPRCTAKRMARNGQHGVHYRCGQLMRYRGEQWVCTCGASRPQQLVVAHRAGFNYEGEAQATA